MSDNPNGADISYGMSLIARSADRLHRDFDRTGGAYRTIRCDHPLGLDVAERPDECYFPGHVLVLSHPGAQLIDAMASCVRWELAGGDAGIPLPVRLLRIITVRRNTGSSHPRFLFEVWGGSSYVYIGQTENGHRDDAVYRALRSIFLVPSNLFEIPISEMDFT